MYVLLSVKISKALGRPRSRRFLATTYENNGRSGVKREKKNISTLSKAAAIAFVIRIIYLDVDLFVA